MFCKAILTRVLPTFVIGLREGVEASLIVAAFLRQQGRGDALRLMSPSNYPDGRWIGVRKASASYGPARRVATRP